MPFIKIYKGGFFMLPIPFQPLEQLETYFKKQKIPNNLQWAYKKWLLGHSDVRTTMIYTYTIKSQTLKEAKSPLDFK
jgi:hypothetical protein